MEQLDLFPGAPLSLRPSRRLRHLGFELEQLARAVARLIDHRRELDQNASEFARLVAEAKATGDVPKDAYAIAVKHDDVRDNIASKLRDIDELHRVIERKLAKGIECHLAQEARRG